MSIDFSLVVPFFNEEENVVKVCEELFEAFSGNGFQYEIIAVNNGSWDKTPELIAGIVQRYPSIVRPVRVEVNQGLGWGVRQGFKVAQGTYVGYSAGDGQIAARDVLAVYREAKKEDLDFCQGHRIKTDTSVLRKINSFGHNFIFHFFFGCPVRDIGSNPKIFKRKWLDQLNLVSKDWFIDGELILKFHLFKARMKEVPIIFRKRELGESKINFFSIFRMFWNIVKWKCRILLG